MKNRTIEEIHDKKIGHKRFAKFIDLAISSGHKIADIKEFYSKFKFRMDGYQLEFDKTVEFSAGWFLSLCEATIFRMQELEELQEKENDHSRKVNK